MYMDCVADARHRCNSHDYHIRPNYAIDSNSSCICTCTIKRIHMHFPLVYLVDHSINNQRIYAYLCLFTGTRLDNLYI